MKRIYFSTAFKLLRQQHMRRRFVERLARVFMSRSRALNLSRRVP